MINDGMFTGHSAEFLIFSSRKKFHLFQIFFAYSAVKLWYVCTSFLQKFSNFQCLSNPNNGKKGFWTATTIPPPVDVRELLPLRSVLAVAISVFLSGYDYLYL